MRVWIDRRLEKIVKKSGIGKAIEHQIRALENIPHIKIVDGVKEDYDIVHFNIISPSTLVSAWQAKQKNKKVVVHAHSTMEDFENSFVGSNTLAPLFKKWIVFCYNSGDIIITPTAYSKRLLRSYGITKPIHIVSNGIDLQYYQKSTRVETNERKKIISVGHYIERKGLPDFVEMAKRLPEYDFYWYGHTDTQLQTPTIKEVLRTELPNLHFPGYVDKETLKQHYNDADLFLFMTHEETEGIVLLEAFAMELPVLVRDIEIYRESFVGDVDLYKFSNLDECQAKIRGILTGKLPNLTANAYEKARQWDINKVGEKLADIYRSLLYSINDEN